MTKETTTTVVNTKAVQQELAYNSVVNSLLNNSNQVYFEQDLILKYFYRACLVFPAQEDTKEMTDLEVRSVIKETKESEVNELSSFQRKRS